MGQSAVSRFVRHPDVVSRALDGEWLLAPALDRIDDGDDCFHVLKDPVSARVWELLGQERTLEELVGAVVEEFTAEPGRVRTDLEAFLGSLIQAGALLEV